MILTNAVLIPVAGPDWFRGWMTVGDDGRITGIGPGDPPPHDGEVLDVGGAMVAPGFVSAHSHLFTSGLRGIAASSTLYPWVRAMMEVFRHCDAEDIYWATVHGACDFLANGITSAYNFTQSRVTWLYDAATARTTIGGTQPPEFVARQFDAAADAGLRTVNSIRLDDEAGPEADTLAVFAELVAASGSPASTSLGASVFGAVQWASGPRTAELEAQVMRLHGVTNQAHLVETAEGLDVQRAKFDWYRRAGALGPDLLVGHFVHPTPEMVDAVVDAGCAMAWQPTSNGRLGSGVADVITLRRRGMRVGMGLDDQSCTDVSDPFANMRLGLYSQRALHTDAAVLEPRDVLRMHTLGSAEALGVADRVGSLEVGKYADFVVVDHRDPTTGPVWDVLATYVLACGLRNLKQVHVGGRLVRNTLAARADDELRERMARAAHHAGLSPAL
jgi:cytosine/adenosine deaminase-related metal-dependent hydrolase